MRTISVATLAEQRKLSGRIPAMSVTLSKGATVYQFTLDDSPSSRLKRVFQFETPIAFEAANTPFYGLADASKITINDYDNTYVDINLRGFNVIIGWGYEVSGSPVYSYAPTMKVIHQQHTSSEEGCFIDLYCVDRYTMMDLYRIIGGVIQLNGTPTGNFTIGEVVTGGTSGAEALVTDGDESTYIQIGTVIGGFEVGETVTGADSGETIEITSIERPASWGTPPSYDRTANTLQIIKAALSGIAEVVNDTDPVIAGDLKLNYRPSITDLDQNDTVGYLVRRALEMTLCGLRPRVGMLHLVYLNSSKQSRLVGTPSGAFTLGEVVLQESTGAYGNFVYQASTYIVVQAVRGTFDTVHVCNGLSSAETITPSSTWPYDYEYLDSEHAIFEEAEGISMPNPNSIYFCDYKPTPDGTVVANFVGSAEDAGSVAAFGRIIGVYEDATIQSNEEATERAEAKLLHVQLESYLGKIVAPMNIAQETLDYVTLVDSTRSNNVVAGWVGRIERLFDPEAGKYEITVYIGSVNRWNQPTSDYRGRLGVPSTNILDKWFAANILCDVTAAVVAPDYSVAKTAQLSVEISTQDTPTAAISVTVAKTAAVVAPDYSVAKTSAPSVSVACSELTACGGAVADDGGSQTDETTAANNATANDMTLLPATPAENDAYYFGYAASTFAAIWLKIGTFGAGTWDITWEYWDGDSWEALSDVDDETGGFKPTASGTIDRWRVSWTIPGDWATCDVASVGEMYWVRARVSSYTSKTTQPKGTQAWIEIERV